MSKLATAVELYTKEIEENGKDAAEKLNFLKAKVIQFVVSALMGKPLVPQLIHFSAIRNAVKVLLSLQVAVIAEPKFQD